MIFIGFQFLKTKRFKLSEEHIKINSSSVIFFRDFLCRKTDVYQVQMGTLL